MGSRVLGSNLGWLILIVRLSLVFSEFSGVYYPNIDLNAEDYAGAWLTSKKRFLDTEQGINSIANLEAASFHMVRRGCHLCRTVMSRDYLDFMVEHLSSTTNQIPNPSPQVFELLMKRMKRTSQVLKERVPKRDPDNRLNATIAVMVYSSNTVSASGDAQSKIRKYFFESTFWSVHRYIPNIAIIVGSKTDEEAVKQLNLPIFAVGELSGPLKNGGGDTHLLPKFGLQFIFRNLKETPVWNSFKYVYYTEGDELLHMRNAQEIYNVIDITEGGHIVVPHRMQTLSLAKNYPDKIRDMWPVGY